MKILVTGEGRHGSTREIANGIAGVLRTVGFDVDLRDADTVASIDGYDAVVIGSAVYMGGWMPDATQLVERFKPELAALPVWLFSSGPLGTDDPKPAGDPTQLANLMEMTRARGHRVFAGKLERDSLSIGEKVIARLVQAPEGDFRDWDAIRAWAREIAAGLRTEASA